AGVGDVGDGHAVDRQAADGGAGGDGAGDDGGELDVAQRVRVGVDDAVHADGLAGVGADLEQGAFEGAVQQRGAVEVGLVGDAVDLGDQLRDFGVQRVAVGLRVGGDRKSTRLNSSHVKISYAVFCLKKKK